MSDYGWNWRALSRAVKERDGWRCVRCGASGVELHAHHIVPLSRGGSNDMSNLVTLCRACHEAEHGRSFGWSSWELNDWTLFKLLAAGLFLTFLALVLDDWSFLLIAVGFLAFYLLGVLALGAVAVANERARQQLFRRLRQIRRKHRGG